MASACPTRPTGAGGLCDAGYCAIEAPLAARGQPPAKKLLTFVAGDADDYLWGGEAIVVDGTPVGELSLAGWSPRADACVGLGFVRGDVAVRVDRGTSVTMDL